MPLYRRTRITAPATRSLTLGTAYQATNPARGAVIMITLTSTAALSLSGGTTNTAEIVLGSTSAVASGIGDVVGRYRNSLSGTVVVGINMSALQDVSYTIYVPAGYYFAIRQTAGTVSIVSAFEQAIT